MEMVKRKEGRGSAFYGVTWSWADRLSTARTLMMTTLSQGNGRTGLSGQESRFLNSGQYTVMCQYVVGSDALGLTGDTR